MKRVLGHPEILLIIYGKGILCEKRKPEHGASG